MNRWGPNTYTLAYRLLCIRDGEYCIICGPGKRKKLKLEIDHIDGNAYNNDPDNLCLLCKKHDTPP
ncbi:HNH endonuclease [Chloroflexota bacterium]